MVQREKHSHFGGSAFFCRNDRGKPADTAHCVPAFLRKTKRVVRKQNSFRTVCPKRLLQLSAAGEVFLEGEQPSESLSADSEIPAPCFWRTGKVGGANKTAPPLCPACCFLILETFRWNVSNGIFLSRNRRTRHTVSLQTNPIIILWQKYRMFHVKHFSSEIFR